MASVPTLVCSRSCKDSSPPNLFVSRLLALVVSGQLRMRCSVVSLCPHLHLSLVERLTLWRYDFR